MSPRPRQAWGERPSDTVISGPLAVWIALLVMLAVNIAIALLPLGRFKTPLNLGAAVAQVCLMGLVFMRLYRSSPLVRLTAAAGFLWGSFLFIFATVDFLTRP